MDHVSLVVGKQQDECLKVQLFPTLSVFIFKWRVRLLPQPLSGILKCAENGLDILGGKH